MRIANRLAKVESRVSPQKKVIAVFYADTTKSPEEQLVNRNALTAAFRAQYPVKNISLLAVFLLAGPEVGEGRLITCYDIS